MFIISNLQGGIGRGGKGGIFPVTASRHPGTGWSLDIPGRDTSYPMHSIYASNYPPPPPTAYALEFS